MQHNSALEFLVVPGLSPIIAPANLIDSNYNLLVPDWLVSSFILFIKSLTCFFVISQNFHRNAKNFKNLIKNQTNYFPSNQKPLKIWNSNNSSGSQFRGINELHYRGLLYSHFRGLLQSHIRRVGVSHFRRAGVFPFQGVGPVTFHHCWFSHTLGGWDKHKMNL